MPEWSSGFPYFLQLDYKLISSLNLKKYIDTVLIQHFYLIFKFHLSLEIKFHSQLFAEYIYIGDYLHVHI